MKKAIIIALSLILVLAFLTSCEEVKHEHTWNDGEVTTAATCANKGVKTFTCTVCKETKTEEIPVDPKNHTWNDGEVTTAATCAKKGVKTYTCTACKETKTEEIPVDPNNHSWDDGKVNNEGTCKEEKLFTCTLCNETKTEELHVDPSKHTWNGGEVTTAATCTEKGVKTYTCSVCNGTKTEEIPVDSDNHTWDEGVITKAATCTEKGVKTYTCTACKKETKTEEIDALGHNNAVEVVEPGYINKGYTKYDCSTCGAEEIVYSDEELKDINKVWLKADINEYGSICLALQSSPEYEGNNEFTLYAMSREPIELNETDYYELMKVFEGVYSLELGENPTITVPDDQICNISEVTSEGITTITIKDMTIVMDEGEITRDWEFTVVPSHTFSGEADFIVKEYENELFHRFYSCYVCDEDEHPSEQNKIVLMDPQEELENHYGDGGFCEGCGKKLSNP